MRGFLKTGHPAVIIDALAHSWCVDKENTGQLGKQSAARPAWEKLLAESFLSPALKEGYLALLQRKFEQLEPA